VLVVHGGLLTPLVQGLAATGRTRLQTLDEAALRRVVRSEVTPTRLNGRTLLLPAFIGALALAQLGRRRTLSEHVVFGLHCASFMVLAGVLVVVPLELLAPAAVHSSRQQLFRGKQLRHRLALAHQVHRGAIHHHLSRTGPGVVVAGHGHGISAC
jgi:hypothetical protein